MSDNTQKAAREFHPAADLFPLLAGAEFREFVDDVREHGLLEPIEVAPDGRIVEGRNRYRACLKADIEPRFRPIPSGSNPYEYAWSKNAERRHLAPGTKAVIRLRQLQASEAWQRENERAREEANRGRSEAARQQTRSAFGAYQPGPVSNDTAPDDGNRERDRLAKVSGTSPATAARAIALIQKRPDLADQVQANVITLNEAARQMRKGETAERVAALPDNVYRVIYADPPWKYGCGGAELAGYSIAEHVYDTMSIEELCAMEVKSIAADDAVLFLWVTFPKLDECWPVIPAWGFKYKTAIVWDKVKHNYGHYLSARAELLLVCTRGSCTPDVDKKIDNVISIPKSNKHSEKPERFREIIDELYPHGRRIELFARKRVPGWDAWGFDA